MQLAIVPVTAFVENVYILADEESKEAIIIDPGGESAKLLEAVRQMGVTVKHILCTHGHMDHVGAVLPLREATGARYAIHENDAEMARREPPSYLHRLIPDFVQAPEPDALLQDGDVLTVGALSLRVIETPGHTMGSLCLLANGALFAGDTLFQGSVGRTDFPGSSPEALVQSIRGRLFLLAPETVVFPGHGGQTTIGQEKVFNPFVGEGASPGRA
ncbi:MAG: MBL fold metallo-hydrolase [Dehalococcoidia bacterium]|nr:MBL fold metallo-hydrolase [Dehalococcoidia bacterium]